MMKTLDSTDYKNYPGNIPGDNEVPNISEVSPFSETKIAFDQYQDTHQTLRVQDEPGQNLSPFLDQQQSTMSELMRRVSNPELEAFRIQNPFLEVSPFPNRIITVVAPGANYSVEVFLPDNCQAVKFANKFGSPFGDFFISVFGQIQFPIVTNLDGNGVMVSPDHEWYYVKNIRSLSVGLLLSGDILSIECLVQL